MKNILCVDIGTSSLKAAVISETGKQLAWARRKFLLKTTDHASKEWLPSLQNAINDLGKEFTDKVSAICISGNGPTLVTVSGETFLWNEKVPQMETKSLFVPRIVEFKKKLGDTWNSSRWIFSGPEYLIWLLTDKAVTILPEERFTDAYWTKDELLKFGMTDDDVSKLPLFVSPASIAGKLTHKAVSFIGGEDIGIAEGLPVYCGAPDFIAALVGTNTLSEGTLCDRAGSSEGINFCSREPVLGEGIRTLPSVIPGLWNASYLLPDSGSKFSAFKQKIERELGREIPYDDFVKMLIESDGSVASLDQGKWLMIQANLDIKSGIDTLRKAASEKGLPFPSSFTIAGGQSQNAMKNQMKADITGMRIDVPECSDAELLGDAIFALTGMGIYESLEKAASTLCKSVQSFIPNEEV